MTITEVQITELWVYFTSVQNNSAFTDFKNI